MPTSFRVISEFFEIKAATIKNAEEEANNVMKNGILIGCHQGLSSNDLDYMTRVFKKFLNNYL